MSQRLLNTWAGGLTAALLSTFTFGQSTFGSFTGTVKDPTGALVPSAAVEVTNEGTGASRQVTTSSAGVFNVPNLDLGMYKVRISAKGFATYERTGLRLTANDPATDCRGGQARATRLRGHRRGAPPAHLLPDRLELVS